MRAMKNTRCGLLVCAAMFLFIHVARAGDSDLNITCEKKKFEPRPGSITEPQHSGEGSTVTEHWGYKVSIENQGFKNLSNLEVKYIIFFKQEQLGIKGPPRKETISGTYTIPEIDSLATTSFETDPVKLTKSSLVGPVGGYTYFTNGAKPSATDTLTGLWVRVYQNGNLFAEYAYPAGLTSSETWR
jgi:hypothetical protein